MFANQTVEVVEMSEHQYGNHEQCMDHLCKHYRAHSRDSMQLSCSLCADIREAYLLLDSNDQAILKPYFSQDNQQNSMTFKMDTKGLIDHALCAFFHCLCL